MCGVKHIIDKSCHEFVCKNTLGFIRNRIEKGHIVKIKCVLDTKSLVVICIVCPHRHILLLFLRVAETSYSIIVSKCI